MELRHDLRLRIHCPVSYSGDGIVSEGTIVNLSTGGWQVRGDRLVKAGTPLLLRVSLPDGPEPIEVELAAVRWADGQTFGLKNIILGEEQSQRLRRFLVDHVMKPDMSPGRRPRAALETKHAPPRNPKLADTMNGEEIMEDRTTSRCPVHCPIVFKGDRMLGKGTLTNLSLSGCGVESTTILQKGVYLSVAVNLPNQESPLDIGLATVRWSLGSKFGLEFIRVGSGEQAQLRQLVAQNS